MGEVGDILETCMLLDQRLADTDDSKNRVDVILEHISLAENKLKVKCPQFRAGKKIIMFVDILINNRSYENCGTMFYSNL